MDRKTKRKLYVEKKNQILRLLVCLYEAWDSTEEEVRDDLQSSFWEYRAKIQTCENNYSKIKERLIRLDEENKQLRYYLNSQNSIIEANEKEIQKLNKIIETLITKGLNDNGQNN